MEELDDREWEIEEYRSDENRSGNKASWILNKGLGLCKKILFAGFAVSSASLALPPLLVFSAIGLVVSVPSVIFLASHACTEKLMSKLLPIPQEEEEHRGVKRKIRISETGYEIEEDEESEEEGESVASIEESSGRSFSEEEEIKEEIVVEVGDEDGEPELVEVTTVVVEVKGNGVKEKEIESETKGSLEEIRDEGKAVDAKKTESEVVATSTGRRVSEGDMESIQTTSSADEEMYDGEKIWEQIEAVRKIVGYKATAQKTSVEELKALYIFTGVEPPSSFKEPSDLAEVQNKLQFLKSIIGVN